MIKPIPLKQIYCIRLSHIPTSSRPNNYSCNIRSLVGEAALTSTQYVS